MTMNATRTTLRQALPRWQRGTVRAVLLMGALAGITLGSAALLVRLRRRHKVLRSREPLVGRKGPPARL